ncbi:MAG TPA: peptidoglycan DD-metalloendopeptidase family protein [Candidatus Paceibacterota bacterium]|nr:peptidoglycan DD-metalloendopeptidase family protein [Candidatus Paceibacterota bacterium]
MRNLYRPSDIIWISAAVAALAIFAYPTPERAHAAASRFEELQSNITNRESEIRQLEREIEEYQTRLENVGSQKQSLQSTVNALDVARQKLAKEISLTERKIDRTELNIEEIEIGIRDKEIRIDRAARAIGQTLRKIDEAEANTLLEAFLGSDSIASFLGDISELARMQEGIQSTIATLRRLKTDLSDEQRAFENEKRKLVSLSDQIQGQKSLADQRRKDQNVLLAETKRSEATYKKILAESIARKKQFEREIEEFEAQLRAEIDPNSIPRPGTKALAFPLDNVLMTQKFGRTMDAKRLYTSGTHNGVDFRATPGTPVKAAADGIVEAVGDTDRVCRGASYGRWVLIRHKNGLSTISAHLELAKVREGQSVLMGDLIGYSGATGYATGPHLHFTVLASSAVQVSDLPSKSCPKAVFHIPFAAQNAYLDPEAYF